MLLSAIYKRATHLSPYIISPELLQNIQFMQMDFESKSVEEVGEWLKSEKFSAKIVQDFASKYISDS